VHTTISRQSGIQKYRDRLFLKDRAQTTRYDHDPIKFNRIVIYVFFRERNVLKAATASVDRIRSPNKWLS
jgi:hypothetical protein